MNEKLYTQKELIQLTGLKNSQINYLVAEQIIPCIKHGARFPRKFPEKALQIIKERQKHLIK